ncbi:MAG: hypothetical protein KGD61_00085 [Candidatus Lokiarchaeota archaeon]|nr:hypothetical protein [Candidatus Lokiarchaeota archaeon]
MNGNKKYREDADESRSIRAHDKLNYRIVIQNKINDYLNSIGSLTLGQAVQSLRNSVYFEIPGLPFKSEIDKKERELMTDYHDNVMALIKQDRDSWIHPIKKLIADTTFRDKYFMDLAEFLLNLIAEHDGLMQVKGIVELGNTAVVEEGGVDDVVQL